MIRTLREIALIVSILGASAGLGRTLALFGF